MADANDPLTPGTPSDITRLPNAMPGTATTTAPGAITSEAPALEETRIALPLQPRRQPVAPEAFQRRLAILDNGILLPLLLGLAFFVAARPVINSDVLMHLASGRALVEGKYNPFSGQDPFAHTTAGARWVNHSWLYDGLLYALHALVGIPGLDAIKALLMVALAFVLVHVGRSDRGLVVPVLSTALGLLVLSPRLLLQPVVVSFLFLGLTLWLLQRGGGWLYNPESEEEAPPVTWRNYWPLLVLFAFWANLDEWFFLGPLTVGLYALGQLIQARQTEQPLAAATPRPGEVRALGLTFVLGLAACLVNPQHVFVFQLPPQLGLGELSSVLSKDSYLASLFLSPFNAEFFRVANISVAALAYFPLVLLGVLSFALEFRNLRWWRVVLFAFFLALSAWHLRAVPFFAAVAAPVMALNFQDALRRWRVAALADVRLERARQHGLTAGRLLTAALLLLGLAAAWPGWLQSRPYERSRVALVDELDPSLRQAALWFKEQHDKGTLPEDARGFNTSPEIANAFAWYCPQEKGFFDYRYDLFSGAATDYVAIRKKLLAPPSARPEEQAGWEDLLDKHKVDHLVLYHRNGVGLQPLLLRLWNGSGDRKRKDWVQLYADGRTVVFGWAKARPAYRNLRLDARTQAYAPTAEQQAPAEGMKALPTVRPFWLAFSRPLPQRSLESDEALLHLSHFQTERVPEEKLNRQVWQLTLASGIVGGAGPVGTLAPGRWLGPLYVSKAFDEGLKWPADRRASREEGARMNYVRSFLYGAQFLRGRDAAPPEHLLLAARAARRGLARNPEDALGLARLGDAYFQRLALTREGRQAAEIHWTEDSKMQSAGDRSPLNQLRFIQAITALEQSLLLQPDQPHVHAQLAILYHHQGFPGQDGRWHHGFWDLELLHRKEELKYARRAPQVGEPPEHFQGRIEQMEQAVKKLQTEVDKELIGLENSKRRFPRVLSFAQEAFLNRNLGGKALQILLGSNLAAFGEEGARLQIELALSTGRVREVSKWFEDADDKEKGLSVVLGRLGPFVYPWWRAMLAAATGDYAEADKHLLTIAGQCARTPTLNQMLRQEKQMGLIFKKNAPPLDVPRTVALLVGRTLLDAPLQRVNNWWADSQPSMAQRTLRLQMDIYRCSAYLIDEAQVQLLRGLLALEQGDTRRAAEAFRTAAARLDNLPRHLPARALAEEYLWELYECWGLRPFGLAQK